MCSREQGFYQTGGTEMAAKQTPLFDLLRIHADDIHSAHGHNKSSTLLSQAADRIAVLEAERDRLKNLVAMAELAIGEHCAPSDCYSTGPLTGGVADHLCPACAFIAVLREGGE